MNSIYVLGEPRGNFNQSSAAREVLTDGVPAYGTMAFSTGMYDFLTCSRSRPSAVITNHMRGGCQDRYFVP